MRNRWLLNHLTPAVLLGAAWLGVAPAAPSADESLVDAIERLADSSFEQRRAATHTLWAAGEAARPLLEAAAESKNAEVRSRAQTVLDHFKYGILATTPAEDVALIGRFRQGDRGVKTDALKQLAERGSIEVVLRLLKLEPDKRMHATVRAQLIGYLEKSANISQIMRMAGQAPTSTLRSDFVRIALTKYENEDDFNAIVRLGATHADPEVRRAIGAWIEQSSSRFMPVLIEQGEYATVERLLELSAVGELGMRHLAVYALLRGDLEQRIDALRQRISQSAEAEDADAIRLLAWLLRAKGDRAAAREVVGQLGDAGHELMRTLLAESADWEAARRFNEASPRPSELEGAPAERLGFRAAYERLAGDEKAFRETIDELIRLANANLSMSRHCAEVLLIHGETDRAIQLKQTEAPIEAFELMCEQFRYAEAFRLAEIGEDEAARHAWFVQMADDARTHANRSQQRLGIGLYAAQVLARVGHRNEAQEAFELIGQALRTDGFVSRIRSLCDAELKSGFKDLAFQHSAMIVGKDRSILSTLFPKNHPTADTLWDYFRQVDSKETYATTLGRIRQLLYRRPGQTSPPVGLEPLIDAIERAAVGDSPAKQARWLHAAGRTAELWGRRDLAKRCFGQAAEHSASAAFSYADQCVVDTNWLEAAHWYRVSWELDHRRAGSIFLQGKMLANAGRADEGRQLMELARLMPLADSEARYQQLAAPLKSHQLGDEAARQWKLIAEQGIQADEEVLSAVRDLGNVAERTDPLAAADYWERMLLACLQLKFRFVHSKGYIQIPYLVHKTRGRGLLAAERTDQAVTSIERAHRICPGDGGLVELVVPALEAAGRPELADQLFDKTYEIMAASSRLFAHSSVIRNDLAWMSARCNRRLDEALQLAEAAVEFSPRTASYIDTLGEVHFRRGELTEAIACAERCLEIEPDNRGYQKQLDRFRASQ